MEYVAAGDARIPALGLGTWQVAGERCEETVRTALELGYRHVDTAQAYGNEAAVGRGLAAADVDREDVFLTTKVWRSNLRRGDLQASVRDSLDALGVAAVDCLLLHWPHPRVPAAESLAAAAELVDDGLVRYLGVSNYTREGLDVARAASDVPLVTDQVQYHPYVDQSSLLSYCCEHDLALTAYSPLARGAVLDDPVLAEIGDRYGNSAAQVALRWLVQQPGVVAIPKATGVEHLRENRDVFDFALTDAEMARVGERTGGLRVRLRAALPGLVRRFPF
ncbi:MAG: aldo/keto reductase [Halobacteriaceae archaeon]